MLTAKARAPEAQGELDAEVDATFEAMLQVVALPKVLASLARLCEQRRIQARNATPRRNVDESVYDLVQGRIELAIDDMKRIKK